MRACVRARASVYVCVREYVCARLRTRVRACMFILCIDSFIPKIPNYIC